MNLSSFSSNEIRVMLQCLSHLSFPSLLSTWSNIFFVLSAIWVFSGSPVDSILDAIFTYEISLSLSLSIDSSLLPYLRIDNIWVHSVQRQQLPRVQNRLRDDSEHEEMMNEGHDNHGGTEGRMREGGRGLTLWISRAILQILVRCLNPFSSGTPDTNIYASPIVSTCHLIILPFPLS